MVETIRFEHRFEPVYWVAGIFEDGTEFAVGVSGTDTVRVSAPATSRELWWIELDRSGRIVSHGEVFPCVPDAATLARIAEHGAEIAAAVAPLFEDEASPLYIRFGRLPKGGRSRNHADGTLEPGVSCYRARRRIGGGYILAGGGLPMAAIAGAFGAYDGVYLLAGEYVGFGSDGEPCIKSPQLIAELRYVQEGHFEVIANA